MATAPAEELVDRAEILPLLGPVKRSGEWLMTFCPVHADGTKHGGRAGQSLGLSDAGVLRCFAGCEFKAIIEALRGPHATRQPRPIRQEAGERLVKVYEYREVDGTLIAEKGRFEGAGERKSFRWRLPGAEGWPPGSTGLSMAQMPLYGVGLLELRPDEPVYFVEGEKACEACWDQGLLAVTHGGGAGIRDFGEALGPLRGRTVYLWADNDAAGAEYMTFLRAKLGLMGCDVRIVSVSLPPKGDAFDWFAAGHTIGEIEAAVGSEPVIAIPGEDQVRITLPTTAGPVVFSFSAMEKKRRQFDCEISVSCFTDPEPWTQNLNLGSASSVTELRRNLNEVFGKEYGWTRVLNKVFGLARDTYLAQERGKDLADVPDSMGEMLLVPPLVVADGPTIWFGDGSSLKSYVSADLAYCMAHGLDFCGMRTPQLAPLIIDYEDSETNYRRRVKRLALSRGTDNVGGVYYWPPKGMALIDQVDALKHYVERKGIGVLIVDSVAPACGGDVLDVRSVLELFMALKRIGLPAILIAHVTKAMDTMKPYGVVYWHNEARRTWYVHRVQDEESDEVDVGFYCRKVNDGPMPKPIAFHVSFSEDQHGPVSIALASMDRAPRELVDQTSTRNRIWLGLGGQPRTAKDLAEETGLNVRTIEKELQRGPFARAGTGEPSKAGGPRPQLWTRLANENSLTRPQTPQTFPLTTPKGVSERTVSIGMPQTANSISSLREEEEMRCWKCGGLANAYDGELRPVCEEHNQ